MDKCKFGSELPEKLAELGLADSAGEGTRTRVLRERKPAAATNTTPAAEPARNRRTRATPRKRSASSGVDVERLYLDKNTKLSPRALETIAEEGGCGGRKLRRHIRFAPAGRPGHGRAAADKARKRRARIKKLLSDGFLSRNKISMQAFMRALQQDEPRVPTDSPAPTIAETDRL